SAEQIATAHRLLDAGVDVILGHHPHVLEPAEVYRRNDGTLGLVAYSLGNFVSNQSRTYAYGVQPDRMGDTRDGVALSFSLVKKDYGGGVVRVEIADLSAQPLWTDNNALDLARDPALAPAIGVVSLDAELLRAREALEHAAGEARVPFQKRIELLA